MKVQDVGAAEVCIRKFRRENIVSRRWIRLDVGWDESEWVVLLDPAAQLAWVKLLCHVKVRGKAGKVKALSEIAAAKKWNVPPRSVRAMLEAAQQDEALRVENGRWVVANWPAYQEVDKTSAARKRKQRGVTPP